MQGIVRGLRWIQHPQLFAVFVVLCLLVAAWGHFVQARPLEQATPAPQIKGIATIRTPMPQVDCAARACVALTFDDGPDSTVTPAILDILARHQVTATFFVVGREIAGREHVLRRIHQQGSEIGNHSWNHPDFTALSPAGMQNEWQRTQAAIVAAGVPAPRLFRPPYGAVNAMVRSQVPLAIARWDVDTEDWMTHDPTKIADHMVRDVRPGSIILLHDKYAATTEALDWAISVLKQQYQLVTVSQLLAIQEGDQGQYFHRGGDPW